MQLGLHGVRAAEPIPAGMMLNLNQFQLTVQVTQQLQQFTVDEEIPSARRCSLSINEEAPPPTATPQQNIDTDDEFEDF